jgi:hypothetical protein
MQMQGVLHCEVIMRWNRIGTLVHRLNLSAAHHSSSRSRRPAATHIVFLMSSRPTHEVPVEFDRTSRQIPQILLNPCFVSTVPGFDNTQYHRPYCEYHWKDASALS